MFKSPVTDVSQPMDKIEIRKTENDENDEHAAMHFDTVSPLGIRERTRRHRALYVVLGRNSDYGAQIRTNKCC